MDSKLETIKKAITKPMEEMNIVVDSVTWTKENKYYYLNIVLDRAETLDIDTIVEATNIINPIIDELDLIEEEYVLDISSKERG